MKAEKYLTREQRKKQEDLRRVEEDARAAVRADNWRDRGLDMMMGGVLEVRREDELKKDIPLPGAFMLPLDKGGKAPEEWTEDEQKTAKLYEQKCKDLQEEREKFRKVGIILSIITLLLSFGELISVFNFIHTDQMF